VRSNTIRLGATSIQNGSFSFDSTLQTGGVTSCFRTGLRAATGLG
jgi:hypothetical protein